MAQEKDILHELNQVVNDCKLSTGIISWDRVQKVMDNRYPDLKRNRNSWRMLWRRNFDTRYKVTKRIADSRYNHSKLGLIDVDERIVHQIKKRKELHYIADLFGFTDDEFLLQLQKLKLAGYGGIEIWQEGDKIFVQNRVSEKRADNRTYQIEATNRVKIAVVSDTHLGSNYEALTELKNFYDYIAKQGIKTVLHIGDLTDGYYTNRPTSIFEQHAVGFQNQLNYFVDNYPKVKGITTYAITGNHDFTHTRNGAANIGEMISRLRDDIVYMGHNHAVFNITDNCKISLIHPIDGSTQTISYKIQQIIDRNPTRHADIVLVGHYHKTNLIYYKNIYGIMVPSFEHLSAFMLDNNLTSDVGGLILDIALNDDGTLKSLTTEWVMYK